MNRTFVISIFAAAFVSLLLCACSGDGPSGGQQLTPAIYGRVLDSGGQPVANAAVGLRFSITKSEDTSGTGNSLGVYPNPVVGSTVVRYDVLSPQHISLKLLRWDTGTEVLTAQDAMLEAGVYANSIDMKGQPNQLYIVRCNHEQGSSSQYMLLNNPESFNALVTTDNDGRFVIHYSSLPTGIPFRVNYENGITAGWFMIGDSLGITIADSQGKTLVQSLAVDTTSVVSMTMQLQ